MVFVSCSAQEISHRSLNTEFGSGCDGFAVILTRLRRFNRNKVPPSLYRKPCYLLPIMLCLQYGHLMLWTEQMDLNFVNMRLVERLLPQKSPILHMTDLFFLLLIFWSQLPGSHTGTHTGTLLMWFGSVFSWTVTPMFTGPISYPLFYSAGPPIHDAWVEVVSHLVLVFTKTGSQCYLSRCEWDRGGMKRRGHIWML